MSKNNYYTIQGVLHKKFEEQQITEKFKKREFVLEVTSEGNDGTVYTELPTFELVQGACERLNYFEFGEPIEVTFSLRGRKYAKKDGSGDAFFTTLKAFNLQSLKVKETAPPQAQSAQAANDTMMNNAPEDDSLPF